MKLDFNTLREEANSVFYSPKGEEVTLRIESAEVDVSSKGNDMLVLSFKDANDDTKSEVREWIVDPSTFPENSQARILTSQKLFGFALAFGAETDSNGDIELDSLVGKEGKAVCYAKTSEEYGTNNTIRRYIEAEPQGIKEEDMLDFE